MTQQFKHKFAWYHINYIINNKLRTKIIRRIDDDVHQPICTFFSSSCLTSSSFDKSSSAYSLNRSTPFVPVHGDQLLCVSLPSQEIRDCLV